MRLGRMLAAALLTALLVWAGSSCSADISDMPPQTWCAGDFGNVRSSTFHDSQSPVVACPDGQICASEGDFWVCCDLSSSPECATRFGGTEDGLYCATDGWERLPMNGAPGTICAPNETCAERKGSGCRAVCCDPRKDPDCGNPSQACIQ